MIHSLVLYGPRGRNGFYVFKGLFKKKKIEKLKKDRYTFDRPYVA